MEIPGLEHDPVSTLAEFIKRRRDEQDYLFDELARSMDTLNNLSRVNEIIATSPRPDLVMTQRATMMPLESVDDPSSLNNFIPNMCGFGVAIYRDGMFFEGRRPYTDKERKELFDLGARGGLNATGDYAEKQAQPPIDREFAETNALNTHINKEAFMRMWILFPELTEWLMDYCLDESGEDEKLLHEALFVAYNTMLRLVDIDDEGVRKADGSIDTGYLCH